MRRSKPYVLGLLAEAYGAAGRPEEGLNALAKVASVMETTESRWYKAELFRLKGNLLLQQAVPMRPSRSLLPPGPRHCPPAAPNPGNCAPPRAWHACGSSRTSRMTLVSYSPLSIAGSPKGLIRRPAGSQSVAEDVNVKWGNKILKAIFPATLPLAPLLEPSAGSDKP